MTVGGSDLSRALPRVTQQPSHCDEDDPIVPSQPHPPHDPSHPSDSAPSEPAAEGGASTVQAEEGGSEERKLSQETQHRSSRELTLRGTSQDSSDSIGLSSRSRSVTPTPAISIEPNAGLEWTADMLSLKESEVVTSDTSLAKARGSNTTTTSSMVFPSDDESLDGDGVFGDDTPDEGEGPSQSDHAPKQPAEGMSETVPSTDSDNVSLCYLK